MSSFVSFFDRVRQIFLPGVVQPSKAKTDLGRSKLKKSLGVLDMKSRLSSFEERLKKLVHSTVFKALNEKSLDLDAYTYHADKYGKLLTGGPNRATTNAKRRKMDFYWREWHLCLLYFFFSIADDELRLHGESFLISAYHNPEEGEVLTPELARKFAPQLWARFKKELLAEAKTNCAHHVAMPLLEFVLGTVDRTSWQRRFPRSSTAGYLRDGLQRGFDTLAELGVTFSDEAKAALAWESLRGAEREALEGKVVNVPAEGKAEGKAEEGKAEEGQADDVKTKLVKESFDLLRQSFEGQGGAVRRCARAAAFPTAFGCFDGRLTRAF